MNILECKALTKRYGGKSALEGVELSIEPGRICLLYTSPSPRD